LRAAGYRLAEDDCEDVALHADAREDGEDGDGVGRRDERAEEERGEPAERVAQLRLPRREHEAADDKGREHRAAEREEHRRPEVGEERLHVHVVARGEDDRRQQPHHEELGREPLVEQHRLVVERLGQRGDGGARQHADRRLGHAVDAVPLEQLADHRRRRQRDDRHHDRPAEGRLRRLVRVVGELEVERRILVALARALDERRVPAAEDAEGV